VTPAIDVAGVTKRYRRYSGRRFATLKSALLSGSLVRDLRPEETFVAVDNLSFQVPRGSTFGIVGRNGSGKSTALKLVAGITKPSVGTVHVDGRISALIELGAGFHPEISGRENVFINGIMLGLTKREIERRFDEIVEFAELREFIDAPVKTYSSGMYVRLGFAVAIHVDPDVLLVDEVLAVGDEGFTHKCLDKFAEFRRRGKTILLVTHNLGLVERFCDDALWIDAGRKRAEGEPRRVVAAYVADVEVEEEHHLAIEDAKAQSTTAPAAAGAAEPAHTPTDPTEAGADMFRATEGRWGMGGVQISDVALCGASGEPSHVFHTGGPMTIVFNTRAERPIDDFVFGFGVFNADGVCVYGTNTDIEEYEAERLEGQSTVTITIDRLDLVEGTYKLDLAVHKRDGAAYDYHRLLYTFRVKSRTKDVGICRLAHRWAYSAGVHFKTKAP
jgi:ABC-type polysaccharide/polyol phosphate transport system ATPase subunit